LTGIKILAAAISAGRVFWGPDDGHLNPEVKNTASRNYQQSSDLLKKNRAALKHTAALDLRTKTLRKEQGAGVGALFL
jgi:hypothetical protein